MIVVHVGLRKAGSASLQGFLSTNEDSLRARGVEYPRAGRIGPSERTAHVNIAHDLCGSPRFDPAYGGLAELASVLRECRAATVVLSSEILEDCTTEEGQRLGEALRRGNEPVRIVLILRDLAMLIASSYGQKVKFGVKGHDFDRFFDRRIQMARVDYFATAKRWAQAFGWDALRVWSLDLPGAELIDDFLAVCEISPDGLTRPPDRNVTPGWRVLEAMRALGKGRHGLPDRHPLARFRDLDKEAKHAIGNEAATVGERLGWNAERGQYLTPGQAERCFLIHRRAIKRLNRRLPTPLALPERRPPPPRPFLPEARLIGDLRDFYDDVAAAWADSRAVAPA